MRGGIGYSSVKNHLIEFPPKVKLQKTSTKRSFSKLGFYRMRSRLLVSGEDPSAERLQGDRHVHLQRGHPQHRHARPVSRPQGQRHHEVRHRVPLRYCRHHHDAVPHLRAQGMPQVTQSAGCQPEWYATGCPEYCIGCHLVGYATGVRRVQGVTWAGYATGYL